MVIFQPEKTNISLHIKKQDLKLLILLVPFIMLHGSFLKLLAFLNTIISYGTSKSVSIEALQGTNFNWVFNTLDALFSFLNVQH